MSDKQLAVCIDEIYRVLKKWGYAFITFPAREYIENNMCFCPNCWLSFHKRWHKQVWEEDKIYNLFQQFEIVFLESTFFGSANLNIFGKIELAVKKILNFFLDHLNWNTYMLILRK